MKSRMVIPYHNSNAEGVRQIALKHFKEIYQEFVEKLKHIKTNLPKDRINKDLIGVVLQIIIDEYKEK